MTKPFNFIDRLQVRVALMAIGRSTLRSQGAAGMVEHARQFLRHADLRVFAVSTTESFLDVLNEHTERIANSFPEGGRANWGAARKSLNIFLRDAVYCRPFCEHFELALVEPWLEVPLDSNVYSGILNDADDPDALPAWPGVKRLTPEGSAKLQSAALQIANSLDVARVHLDVRYWRKGLVDQLENSCV